MLRVPGASNREVASLITLKIILGPYSTKVRVKSYIWIRNQLFKGTVELFATQGILKNKGGSGNNLI